jgi:N-acetyl-anhydromuramyl-L-alanine amidase AmpD
MLRCEYYTKRTRDVSKVDTLVIHYMSLINVTPEDPFNVKGCVDLLNRLRVSRHYIIDRRGNRYNLV